MGLDWELAFSVNFDVMLRVPSFKNAKSKGAGEKSRADVSRMVGFTLRKMADGGIHDHVSQVCNFLL